jgi:hypothetical protein
MGALVVEESCMSCHAFQGYVVGDQRGGISVAVPMEPFLFSANETVFALAATHISIWLLGLVIFIFFALRLTRYERMQYRYAGFADANLRSGKPDGHNRLVR